MLIAVFVVLVALVLVLLGVAATRPPTFRIVRTIDVGVPPERVFPHVADFEKWRAWSPWEKKDPALERTLSGAPHGKGARYAWRGNKQVGEGSMEITEAAAPSRLTVRLDFTKPFEAHNVADFTFERHGEVTRVEWAMTGPASFGYKLMDVVLNFDRLVGRDFAEGLKNLKAVAEQQPPG